MNVFCFSGNICRDIELRATQSGKQVANFSVAINEGKDKTEFVNCIAWEKTGELISQYCKKGDRLSGTGRIQTTKWEDKEGNTRYKTEIVVTQFDFPPKRSNAESNTSDEDDFGDEIPF